MDISITLWVLAIVVAVIIGRHKNIDPGNYLALGIVLSWIGVIILLCMKTRLPKAPEGMRAVKCARCNTVQNVPAGGGADCWQCHATIPTGVKPPSDPAKSRLTKCPLCDTRLWIKPTTTKFRCSECDGVSAMPCPPMVVKK